MREIENLQQAGPRTRAMPGYSDAPNIAQRSSAARAVAAELEAGRQSCPSPSQMICRLTPSEVITVSRIAAVMKNSVATICSRWKCKPALRSAVATAMKAISRVT